MISRTQFQLTEHNCWQVSQDTNNEIHWKSGENKGKKLKQYPYENKNRDCNRNNYNVTAWKQNDNKRSQKSFESDQDQVRDNKSHKNDIVILGDYKIDE